MLKNVMEEIVEGIVIVLLNGSDYQIFCKCEQCQLDIISLSLNTLPVHYVTTDKGRDSVFERMNSRENLEWINKRIIQAIHTVGKYPHRS